MTGIHGFIYLAIGVILAFYSEFMATDNEPFFRFFFYVGIVFVFWGVVKLVFSPTRRRKKLIQNQKKQKKATGVVICPRCKNHNYHYSRFCHHCGYKLV